MEDPFASGEQHWEVVGRLRGRFEDKIGAKSLTYCINISDRKGRDERRSLVIPCQKGSLVNSDKMEGIGV